MELEDGSLRHRVAIVVDIRAGEQYLWAWAKFHLGELVADLRPRGVDAVPVRVHVDGFLGPRLFGIVPGAGRFTPTGRWVQAVRCPNPDDAKIPKNGT